MASLRRRILPGMVAAGLVAAALAPAQPAIAESVLIRGMGSTIGTLDPQINFLAVEGQIEDDMYEGLVLPGPDGEPIPGAAATWDITDDGKTYIFHLRDGLKWSNGEPLVAQDFVNGIIRTLDPATASEKAYIFTSTISVTGAADFNKSKNKDPKSVGLSHRTSGPWS
jgi:oligopeptide transport system substrate-binding protein